MWFRQDLRIHDNTALNNAINQCEEIIPIFVLNHQVTTPRIDNDARLWFLYAHLEDLACELNKRGSYLIVKAGVQEDIIMETLKTHDCDALFYNRSYGPSREIRDKTIYEYCQKEYIAVHAYHDYLLVAPSAVPARKVYTPFYKKRLPIVEEVAKSRTMATPENISSPLIQWPTLQEQQAFFPENAHKHWPLCTDLDQLVWAKDLSDYDETRNIPSVEWTTRLSPYLRFWAISPRVAFTYFHTNKNPGHEIIVKELAWREFRQHIAHYFPYAIPQAFQEKRRKVQRENNKEWFEAWKEGKTGYPLVDAWMRQLKQENRMHNRVRMVVASFLTKDLLIDRRRWAQHFEDYLLDHDRNVNTWNWQRSASVWADPKPLRIFNPILQSQRFDKDCEYILKYVPELAGQEKKAIHDPIKYDLDYITPIVDHYVWSKEAKKRYNEAKAEYQATLEE